MKPRTFLSLAALTAGTWLTPAALAELNPALVPADAKWVVYANLAALRETALGQQLIARLPVADAMPAESPLQPNVAKVLDAVGSITGFGNLELSPNQADLSGTLVIQGTADLRKIAEGLIAHATVSNPEACVELTGLPIEAYRLHGEIVIGFPPEPILLVSRSPDTLLQALELYRGEGASLASGRHPLTGLLPGTETYYLYAASQVPGQALGAGENTPQARVLQMTQAACLRLGERGEDLVAAATLESKDNKLAESLVKILHGLTAMLSLAESSDADLTAFINSVRIERQDQRVSLEMAYPTERLVAMLEQHLAERTPPAEAAPEAPAADRGPAELEVEGERLATWVADANRGGNESAGSQSALFTSEPVELVPGARLVITAARDHDELARVDFLELIPVAGGDTVRYEAEFMRLADYRIESSARASGGELIRADEGRATAQLRFHGPAGSYRIRVGYIDEDDGRSTFNLSLVAPAD